MNDLKILKTNLIIDLVIILYKALRSDNGTEYTNTNMRQFLASQGIKVETSAPYVHEQNGRAKREMRTIVECARTMLLDKSMPTRF